jgi:hypothetical protein
MDSVEYTKEDTIESAFERMKTVFTKTHNDDGDDDDASDLEDEPSNIPEEHDDEYE